MQFLTEQSIETVGFKPLPRAPSLLLLSCSGDSATS
jgi:hypothetical protein